MILIVEDEVQIAAFVSKGLRKAGYATDKKYAPKLIKLIEVLKLNKYDK